MSGRATQRNVERLAMEGAQLVSGEVSGKEERMQVERLGDVLQDERARRAVRAGRGAGSCRLVLVLDAS